jgi:hypothetical protein
VADVRVCCKAQESLFEFCIHAQSGVDVILGDRAEDLLTVLLGK